GTAAPATASGTWMAPVRDRYEVGDVVTLVGYMGRTGTLGTLGTVDDGPFYGYLHEAGKAPGVPSERGEPLGPITVEETGTSGWTALRVSIEVSLAGLAPGRYEVGYCNDPCLNGLGDLIGSRAINVGVDPAEPLVREWPLDEPLIQILRRDAMVSGPGYLAPASDIWAGRVLPIPEPSPPPPPPTATPLLPPGADPSPNPGVVVATAATPIVLPQRDLGAPVVTAPDPPPSVPSRSDDDGSPVSVVLGVMLAAACTGGVLRALRQEGTAPAEPLAARPA
ncbi:MAG: hypothetical protein ACRD2W_10850, partial [Acidimicrobiales bacterium]